MSLIVDQQTHLKVLAAPSGGTSGMQPYHFDARRHSLGRCSARGQERRERTRTPLRAPEQPRRAKPKPNPISVSQWPIPCCASHAPAAGVLDQLQLDSVQLALDPAEQWLARALTQRDPRARPPGAASALVSVTSSTWLTISIPECAIESPRIVPIASVAVVAARVAIARGRGSLERIRYRVLRPPASRAAITSPGSAASGSLPRSSPRREGRRQRISEPGPKPWPHCRALRSAKSTGASRRADAKPRAYTARLFGLGC